MFSFFFVFTEIDDKEKELIYSLIRNIFFYTIKKEVVEKKIFFFLKNASKLAQEKTKK